MTIEALIVIFVLLLIPIAFLIWLFGNKPFKLSQSVPGPPCFPVIGLLWFPILNWNNWPIVCYETSKKFQHSTWGGPCFRYGAVFYTDNPANVRHILKDNFSNYEKGKVWRSFFREILGNGIFNADGEIWMTHRKISAKLFSRNLLQYSCNVLSQNCRIIIQQLEEAITLDGKQKTTIDLQDLFFRFTIDNTAETTFGFSMQSLQTQQQPQFVAAFDELQDLCLARMIDPFFEVKRLFQLTRRERRIRKLRQVLKQFCKQIIQDKQQAIRGNNAECHEDILGLFLRHHKQPNEAKEVEELTDVILNFMVAGRDTTAAALSWIFYKLSNRPDVVHKIVVEATEVFGPPDTAEYTYERLNHLKYTHCVVMEALRLHPPVPVDSKFAIANDTLPDGTYIPAGSLITYLPYAMGHNEEIYGPDSLEFKPERFLGQTEPSPYSFSVFNAGPRLCLGKPLAMLTMKLVLVQLLPCFQFQDVAGHPGTMKWSLVGKMKDGFKVQVSKRALNKHL